MLGAQGELQYSQKPGEKAGEYAAFNKMPPLKMVSGGQENARKTDIASPTNYLFSNL